MSWLLFCQIEIILLTVGLVVSFVNGMKQTQKDNSFFRRTAALSEAMNKLAEQIAKKEEK